MARILKFLLASVLFGIFIIACIPSIISTPWGKNRLVSLVNTFIPGRIEVEDAYFSWFHGQSIKGFAIKDPHSVNIAVINSFETDVPLFKIFTGDVSQGSFKVNGLSLNLTEEQPGVTNLENAFKTPVQIPQKPQSPFTLAITSTDINLQLSPNKPLTIHLSGHTKENDVSGDFDIAFAFNSSDKNFKDLHYSDVQLTASVNHFPTALLDRLLSLKEPAYAGLITAAVGKSVDLSLNKSAEANGLGFALTVKAPLLAAAVNGQLTSDKLLLGSASNAALTITPDLVQRIAKLQDPPVAIKLMKAANADIHIKDFAYNLGSEDLAAAITIAIPQLELSGDDLPSTLSIANIHASMDTAGPSKTAAFQLVGETLQQGQSIPFALQANIDKPVNWNTLGEQFLEKSEIKVSLPAIPLKVVDKLFNLKGHLVSTVGEHASLSAQGQLAGDHMMITADFLGDIASLKNLKVDKASDNWQFSADLSTKPGSIPAVLIGDSAVVRAETQQGKFSASLSGKTLTMQTGGKVRGELLYLNQPTTIHYELKPEALRLLNINDLSLAGNTQVDLKIDPISKPIHIKNSDANNIDELFLNGSLTVDQIVLDHTPESAKITNLAALWTINLPDNLLRISLNGNTVLQESAPSNLQGQLEIKQFWIDRGFSLSNAVINTTLQLNQIPVIFLGKLAGQNNLSKIIGKKLDLNLAFSKLGQKSNSSVFDVSMKGEGIEGTLALNVNLGNAITLANTAGASFIRFDLTPERYQALRAEIAANQGEKSIHILTDTAHLNIILTALEIPLVNQQIQLSQAGMSASISVDNLKIDEPNKKQTIVLENIAAKIESKNLARQVAFNVKARDTSLSNYSNEWTFTGSLVNLFSPQGNINLDDMSLDLVAKSNRLPASLLCQIACVDSSFRTKLEALLGQTIDTDISVQLQRMNGPIQIKLKGENGRILADAKLTDNVLTLNRSLEIEVAATPQLGKSLLQDVIPILSGVRSAEKPIKITVDPQGFAVPIKNFDLNAVKIGKATIDLGKIEFNNDGELANVFSLLRPPANEPLNVWFTPLYLQLQDGTLTVYRMDMLLLNQYPIAIWGKLNFPKDQVNLMIGITGAALIHTLKLPVDSAAMIQLPFQGRIGEASIDKAKATTRISALVAQNQGSPHGVIIGTFLDIAGGSFGEKEPPKPTTDPLPWQSLIDESANNPKQSKSDKKKDTIKQIEKGANKLIDKLFR